MDNIIEVKDLKKSYGDVNAVKGISFYVEKGKLFAFLGPNGAGKSTTIDIICTFLKPDAGDITIDGSKLGTDDDRIRSSIGAVFQDGLLDRLLTVEENIKLRGRLYGSRVRTLMLPSERLLQQRVFRIFIKDLLGSFRVGSAAGRISHGL